MISNLPNSALNSNKNWLQDLVSLVIFIGIFYALWIGSHALFTPDEGRYSEVAREMVSSGDYITPRLNGVAFLDKPALYYWLQAIAINLFGLKEWALRFWPAFMGVLGSLMTYICGRILFNRRVGLLGAVMLATSPLYYGAAHYANLDLEVASFISCSLMSFIAAMQVSRTRTKNRLLLAAYIFAACAALTKGLIGIVFPAMIIGLWVLLANRWDVVKKMHLIKGMILFLALALPWYVLVQKENPEFLHFFFVTQQVSRFLTMQDFNSKAAIWFYAPVILAGFFPWSIFLFQSLATKFKAVWADRKSHTSELYLLIWFVVVFTFFSIPRSKTVGYILPIFPVMALLVAKYLDASWDKKNTGLQFGKYLYLLTCVLVAIALFIAPYFVEQLSLPIHFMPYARLMGVVLVISALMGAWLVRKKNFQPFFVNMLITAGVLLLTFMANAETINEKSVKPLTTIMNTEIQPTDEVVAYYKYYQDLPLYAQRRITIVADWQAKDIPHKDNWVREMWYGMVFQDTKNWLIGEQTFWQRWNSEKRLYVVTDADYYKQLQTKTKVYKISQTNNILLLSNKPSA